MANALTRKLNTKGGPGHIISDLRRAGWKVDVQHWRRYSRDDGEVSQLSRGPVRWADLLDPRGGLTVVQLTPPGLDIKTGQGTAECHPNDNYNRRLGVRIALSRALISAGIHETGDIYKQGGVAVPAGL